MVEAFCATWKLVDSHNFDEYMKALGRYGPGWRSGAAVCSGDVEFSTVLKKQKTN